MACAAGLFFVPRPLAPDHAALARLLESALAAAHRFDPLRAQRGGRVRRLPELLVEQTTAGAWPTPLQPPLPALAQFAVFRTLVLVFCGLEVVPHELAALEQLHTLVLTGNRLGAVSATAGSTLGASERALEALARLPTTLRALDLAGNQLRVVEAGVLARHTRLEQLSLANNHLSFLELPPLPDLFFLDLSCAGRAVRSTSALRLGAGAGSGTPTTSLLQPALPSLRRLSLSCCYLGARAASVVARFGRAGAPLNVLDLSGNLLGDAALRAVVGELAASDAALAGGGGGGGGGRGSALDRQQRVLDVRCNDLVGWHESGLAHCVWRGAAVDWRHNPVALARAPAPPSPRHRHAGLMERCSLALGAELRSNADVDADADAEPADGEAAAPAVDERVDLVYGGWLYVGSARAALAREQLRLRGITHVLCAAKHLARPYVCEFCYATVDLDDTRHANLRGVLEPAVAWIHAAHAQPGAPAVLVHCAAGRSRSVALVLAYMLRHGNVAAGAPAQRVAAALAHVRAARPVAGPNAHFVHTLEAWDAETNCGRG